MQKVDITIAVVGAVALLVTGIGIAFYDADETEFSILETTSAFAQQEKAVDGSPTEFTFTAPNNTYGAHFDVDVAFTAAPGAQGSVTVTVVLEDINGNTQEFVGSAPVGDGSLTVEAHTMGWVEIPEDGTYSDDEKADATTAGGPVKVTVTATGGGGILPVGPATTFQATVTGDALVYQFGTDAPDLEAA